MNRRLALLAMACLMGSAVLSGCVVADTGCDGLGRLSITNTSLYTEQAVQVDGVSYGTIFPGETILIDIYAGSHTLSTPGVSGGYGCQPVATVVYECETQYFSCSE